MRNHGGLQQWIERRASGPAFALVALSMIARAAQLYSGGALALGRALGPRGLALFDMLTGLGLAVGAELLASIAGRARASALREMREAQGRRGIPKSERLALVAHYRAQARQDEVFCGMGLLASCAGAFGFLWGTTAHNPATIAGDVLVCVLAVSIVFYLGALHEARGPRAEELAAARVVELRGRIVEEAGRRIAGGDYTPQDVRVLTSALTRQDRQRLEAALIPADEDDPPWSARDVAEWLGRADDASARRQITRKLMVAADRGQGVTRDPDSGAYRLPRSLALRLFASDFLSVMRGGSISAPGATTARRYYGPSIRLVDPALAPRQDMDRTPAPAGPAADAGMLWHSEGAEGGVQ